MAFGNVKNVDKIQPTGGQSTPAVTTASQTNNTIPLDLQKLCEVMGITVEQYLNMSPDAQNELVEKYNQLKAENNMTGLVVERTAPTDTTEVPESSNPTSTDNAEPVVSTEQTTTAETPNNNPMGITSKEWKAMTPQERRQYLRDSLPEEIKNLPREEREQALRELTINRILKDRNISLDKWNSYSEAKQNRLIEKYEADFKLMVQNGYTEKELKDLSLSEKIELERELIRTLKETEAELQRQLDEINASINTEIEKQFDEINSDNDLAAKNSDYDIKARSEILAKRLQHTQGQISLHSTILQHSEKIEEKKYKKTENEDNLIRVYNEMYGTDLSINALTDEQRIEAYNKLLANDPNYLKDNEMAQNDYDVSCQMVALNAKGIKFKGEKSLLEDFGIVSKLIRKPENREKIADYLNNLAPDEFYDFITSLSQDEGRLIISLMDENSEHPIIKDKNLLFKFRKKLGIEGYASHLAQGKKSSHDARADYSRIYPTLDLTDEGKEHAAKTTSTFYDVEELADFQKIVLENNDEVTTSAIIKYGSERDDWEEIQNIVKEYMNSSDTISDEMKDFYNQKSVEYSTNANTTNKSQSSTSSKSDSTTPDSTTSSYTTNTNTTYETAPVNNNYTQAVQVINSFNYETSNEIETAVSMIQEDPKLLSNINNDIDRTKVIENIVGKSEKTDIINLIKNNPSHAMSIIRIAGLKISKEEAFGVLVSLGMNIPKVVSELSMSSRDVFTYCKANKDNAIKIALNTSNKELSNYILRNTEAYGLYKGSNDWSKLNEIAQGRTISNPDELLEQEPPKYFGLG